MTVGGFLGKRNRDLVWLPRMRHGFHGKCCSLLGLLFLSLVFSLLLVMAKCVSAETEQRQTEEEDE